MSAVKITPKGDELAFAWVSSYTPSNNKPPESTSTSSEAAGQGNAAPVAAIIGASVGGVVVLAALAASVVVFRRRAKAHRLDRAQRDLLLHTLVEDHRATSRNAATWPSTDGSTLGPSTPTTAVNEEYGVHQDHLPGGVRVVRDRADTETLYLPPQMKSHEAHY
ncbi:hypothetical protein H9P43_002714 [Blastocladiella emersonii ATCC 22665]|nr:hypothetical protein H9P43_002714 [Blastocladiella emersonii ATCC 22665]